MRWLGRHVLNLFLWLIAAVGWAAGTIVLFATLIALAFVSGYRAGRRYELS